MILSCRHSIFKTRKYAGYLCTEGAGRALDKRIKVEM
jgi:hypothetical protein